jgi:SH3 domain-containing YSC84-like protein 1
LRNACNWTMLEVMKRLIVGLLLMSLALPAMALDKAELDARIRKLMVKFEILQSKSDKRIPAQNLAKAKAVVLLDRTKAGFIFAYQGGNGVALARDPKTGKWSAPAFLKANEASLGFQIGGQQSFMVILLMNTNSAQAFAAGNINYGGEASGTAGNQTGSAEGTANTTEPLSLVYTDKEGLYGGAAIKGDAISPDTDANVAYYGDYLTTKEILFDHKAKPTPASQELAKKLDQYSKP